MTVLETVCIKTVVHRLLVEIPKANLTLLEVIKAALSDTNTEYFHFYPWSNLLPIAEFAYNNAPNATTGLSPFYANKGYHLNLSIHPK